MHTPRAVQTTLPHVWPLFFMQHGQPTPVQLQAIPPILAGKDAIVIAATATGKTEAVLAPLLERYWTTLQQTGLGILYICPTRALVRDLFKRLQPILSVAGITIGMKTGDIRPFDPQQAPAILLTTPESTDSLLTRAPAMFVGLRAIVLDEIHLLDSTARGDHVRCLLPRIEWIREYAQPGNPPAQRVALSATVSDPPGICRRYLHDAVIVDMPGGREIVAEIQPLQDKDQLVAALATRMATRNTTRVATKTLLFCNSRKDVEETAAYLRQHLPYHAEVFVHYSNLDAAVRRDVESRFAALPVAICVCTSTLELGIDIGTVDDVILMGAPADLTSFLQRIGRGGRRTEQVRVLCMARAPGERARFEALLNLAGDWRAKDKESHSGKPAGHSLPKELHQDRALVYGFRPSVVVQQIFSRIKQSPTGAVRLADLRRIAPPEVTSDDIRQIVSHLSFNGYLQPGRLGEWKPGPKLQELIDQHDFYSNIGESLTVVTAVDAYSGHVLGQIDRMYPPGTILLFAGRTMEVVWREKVRLGLKPTKQRAVDDLSRAPKTLPPVPYEVTQAVAHNMGYASDEMVLLPAPEGAWLFHFWGTVWGELLAAILLEMGIWAESVNEYCLHIQPAVQELPPWEEHLGQQVATRMAETLAGRLQMGRFHSSLPDIVAIPATVRILSVERFAERYRSAEIVPAGTKQVQLHLLINA